MGEEAGLVSFLNVEWLEGTSTCRLAISQFEGLVLQSSEPSVLQYRFVADLGALRCPRFEPSKVRTGSPVKVCVISSLGCPKQHCFLLIRQILGLDRARMQS